VTIAGKPEVKHGDPKSGMVIDFAELKAIVNEKVVKDFDHTLVLNESDKGLITLQNPDQRVIYLPFPPTCEMLLAEFHHRILPALSKDVRLLSLRLDETATSFAEWFADDNL
jgi:6-pyruvoyltetrahydropterin/6-carboxytetrahydropterin synthase